MDENEWRARADRRGGGALVLGQERFYKGECGPLRAFAGGGGGYGVVGGCDEERYVWLRPWGEGGGWVVGWRGLLVGLVG